MQHHPRNETAVEVNFDGLVGPTHHYAGLAPGNLASAAHRRQRSNPRAAAQQGLNKMRRLRSLGVPQAVLPPQPRPHLKLLRRLGFRGPDDVVVDRAVREAPHLLAAAMSGSSMWTANAATISPSADSADRRVHFTAANLASSLHRASETDTTARVLGKIFDDARHFVHHDALPAAADLGDEGAANHTRFCGEFGDPGVQLFVYGTQPGGEAFTRPKRFPARQSATASQAVARLHRLDPERVVFARQLPEAIDAGVFHNDVIAVGHRRLLFCHQKAFAQQNQVYDALHAASDGRIKIAEVTEDRLSLEEAVSTYLFNSQIVSTPKDQTLLIAPAECRGNPKIAELLTEWQDDGLIDDAEFVDIDQSMKNGGGPACLRLRVVLSEQEFAAMHQGVLLTDRLADELSAWIDRFYRDSLRSDDLADPNLMRESYEALDQLTQLLNLGSLYDFQR